MHDLNDLSGNSQYSQQQTQYQQSSGTHQTFSQQQYPSQAGYSAQPQGYGNRLHQITPISFSISWSLQMIYSNTVTCAVWLWRCRAGQLIPVSSVSAGPESAVPSIPLHTARTSRAVTEVLLFWTGELDDCPGQMTNQYVPEAWEAQFTHHPSFIKCHYAFLFSFSLQRVSMETISNKETWLMFGAVFCVHPSLRWKRRGFSTSPVSQACYGIKIKLYKR